MIIINNKGNKKEKERERVWESNNALLQHCNKWNNKCCHIYKSYIFCVYTRQSQNTALWHTFCFLGRNKQNYYSQFMNINFRNCCPDVFSLKVFRKYAANLQEKTHAEVWFQ